MIDQIKRNQFHESFEKMQLSKKYDMKQIDSIAKDFEFITSPDFSSGKARPASQQQSVSSLPFGKPYSSQVKQRNPLMQSQQLFSPKDFKGGKRLHEALKVVQKVSSMSDFSKTGISRPNASTAQAPSASPLEV